MKPEDKQAICDDLLAGLQKTRQCHDLVSLTFYPDTEEVIAIWQAGHRSIINVACDSGIAMMRDILRALT